MFPATAEQFRSAGRQIIYSRHQNVSRWRSALAEERKFKAFFGTKAERCSDAWCLLISHGLMPHKDSEPKHLLWGLLLLKLYCTEEVSAGLVGHDADTFRKWAWKFVVALHNLSKKLVSHTTMLNLHFLTPCRSNGLIE